MNAQHHSPHHYRGADRLLSPLPALLLLRERALTAGWGCTLLSPPIRCRWQPSISPKNSWQLLDEDSVRAATSADAVCGMQPPVSPRTHERANRSRLLFVWQMTLASLSYNVGAGTKLAWGQSTFSRRRRSFHRAPRQNHRACVGPISRSASKAGCTIQKLQTALAQSRPTPRTRSSLARAEPLSAVFSRRTTAARCVFASERFANLISVVTLALPDGTLASSGGKIRKECSWLRLA